jgi:hypothetical protein
VLACFVVAYKTEKYNVAHQFVPSFGSFCHICSITHWWEICAPVQLLFCTCPFTLLLLLLDDFLESLYKKLVFSWFFSLGLMSSGQQLLLNASGSLLGLMFPSKLH